MPLYFSEYKSDIQANSGPDLAAGGGVPSTQASSLSTDALCHGDVGEELMRGTVSE